MQTFLPYASAARSVKALDDRRLGKQRLECKQIILAIQDPTYGWQHHPAVNMWRGFTTALAFYGLCACREWSARGFEDGLEPFFEEHLKPKGLIKFPPWWGDEAFHASHRSNLLRKNPIHYCQFGWEEPYDLPYVWPGTGSEYYRERAEALLALIREAEEVLSNETYATRVKHTLEILRSWPEEEQYYIDLAKQDQEGGY